MNRTMRFVGRMNGASALMGIICVLVLWATGCATRPPPPLEPRVQIPPESPRVAAPVEVMIQEEMTGQFVSFGKLRTVILSKEGVVGQDGKEKEVKEIRPFVEKELIKRDFRIFSGIVQPDSEIARVARSVKAQLVVSIEAKSEFVNTTGRFSKFRAQVETKAVRGHDGTLLAEAKTEKMGTRDQDADRAGILALRSAAEDVSRELVEGLLAKTDQLLWAGLVIDHVPSMDVAIHLQTTLEKHTDVVSYVELLDWNKETKVAVYEIIYGLKHESDVASLLRDIPKLTIKPTKYIPGKVEVLDTTVTRYK